MSWKDPWLSADVAGAADFVCPSPFTITQVDVMGYGGNPVSSLFNVTVYANVSSNEPLNTSAAVCATQNVPGASGSSFPTSLQTTLLLATPCTVPAGTYWLEVQMDDPSPVTPWYWETQSATGGSLDADWRDALGSFASPCTPGYVEGLYMQDCVFGGPAGEPDFMFDLTGFVPPPNAPCNTVDQLTGLTDAGVGVNSMARGSGRRVLTTSSAPEEHRCST